jgi:type II secretory pathway pseudopilin PulG
MPNAAGCDGNARQGERAFTLLEMLVVSGMILLLAGLLVAAGAELRKHALVKETTARVRGIEAALEDYYASYRTYPPNLNEYIAISDTDAWGNTIKYTVGGVHNPDGVDLYSYGPDGEDDSGDDDDINNWTR